MFLHLLKWEIRLYARKFGEVLNLAAMFVMAASFFVLSLPHDAPLGDVANGVLWVCALLVMALVQYRIFLSDYEDGTVEQWLFMPAPLEFVVLAKGLAHWLITALPLVLLVPLLSYMLAGNAQPLLPLMLAIAVGSLSFTFIGCMAAAVSLRFRSRDLLTTLLVLPLAVPVLIFGAMASLKPISMQGEWLIILAYIMIAVPLSSVISAALLRMSIK